MQETTPYRGKLVPCGRTFMGTALSRYASKRALCSETHLCPHCRVILRLRREAVVLKAALARSGPQQLMLPGIVGEIVDGDIGEVLEATPVDEDQIADDGEAYPDD